MDRQLVRHFPILFILVATAPSAHATELLGTWQWDTFELRLSSIATVTLFAGSAAPNASPVASTGIFDPLSPFSKIIDSISSFNFELFAEKMTTVDSPNMSMRWLWGSGSDFSAVGAPQIDDIVEPFGDIDGATIEWLEFTWTPTKLPASNPGQAIGRFDAYGMVPEPSTGLLVSFGIAPLDVDLP